MVSDGFPVDFIHHLWLITTRCCQILFEILPPCLPWFTWLTTTTPIALPNTLPLFLFFIWPNYLSCSVVDIFSHVMWLCTKELIISVLSIISKYSTVICLIGEFKYCYCIAVAWFQIFLFQNSIYIFIHGWCGHCL